ncbi:MAG: hypothetical protein AAGF88_09700 [Pseudomonadota bacterium]
MDVDQILMFRVIERLAMTGIIFAIGLFAIWAYRKEIVQVQGNGLFGINTQLNLVLVIFAIMVAYAWANMANPISVERDVSPVPFSAPLQQYADGSGTVRVIGLGENAADIGGYTQSLAGTFLREHTPPRTTLSVQEARIMATLATQLDALRRIDPQFETDLFNRDLTFNEIRELIENGFGSIR